MSVTQLFLHIFLYSTTAWLGLYLLASNGRSLRFWFTSGALLSYALTLLLEVLNRYAPSPDWAMDMLAWQRPLFLLPAFFILLTLAEMTRHSWYEQFTRTPRAIQGLIGCVVLFGLSLVFIFFPLPEALRQNGRLFMAPILFTFGLLIRWIQAHAEEEAFMPPLFRSFDYAFATAILFGGQIIILMNTRFGISFYLLCLLFSTITTSLIVQVFSDHMNNLMDRIAFFNAPQVRQTRAQLREASSEAPRIDMALVADTIDPDEFAKLTRKAISQMGNLPKLSSNPLTRLYLIESTLNQRHEPSDTLNRAAELRRLLTDSIERLRPMAEEKTGITDDWRHYNVLYYPYVRGFKPYSQRWFIDDLAEEDAFVLDWFRSQVPERTLYNWQKAAAQLVAQDLRERSKRIRP